MRKIVKVCGKRRSQEESKRKEREKIMVEENRE